MPDAATDDPRTPADHLRTVEVPIRPVPALPGYELDEAIGRGGFADVFRGRQVALDRPVAVKVIDPGACGDPKLFTRVRTEALTLGRFQHPNIVPVYDYVRQDGRVFIVMELLVGEDLGRRLGRAGKLNEQTAWHVARQAAAGLAHAAAHGVVHRDIKPANLFLMAPPAGVTLPAGVPLVKVTDFGLAQARWAVDGGSSQLTARGTSLGTPAYMAPEQHGGAGPVDHRADLYALGATVYHMLAGRQPFVGATLWDLLAKKQANRPAPLDGVSAESAELVADLMASRPDHRPADYEELLARIDRLPVMAATAVLPKYSTRRRGWLWPVASGLVAATVVVGALWATRPAAQATTPPRTYTAAESPMPLFNGRGLGRLAAEAGSEWGLAADDEKTRVVEGSGKAKLRLLPYPDYQLTLGLDRRAAVVELQVGRDAGPRHAVRVEAGAATFGVRETPGGEFRPLGPASAGRPAASRPGRPYTEVRVERSGDGWAAWYDGMPLGRATDPGRPDPTAWLVVDGPPVRLDTAELTPLVPAG